MTLEIKELPQLPIDILEVKSRQTYHRVIFEMIFEKKETKHKPGSSLENSPTGKRIIKYIVKDAVCMLSPLLSDLDEGL